MNDVAVRPAPQARAVSLDDPSGINLGPELSALVSAWRTDMPLGPIPPAAIKRAEKALCVLARELAPSQDKARREWLDGLFAAGLKGAPASDARYEMSSSLIARVCADLPAACWTDETLVAFLRVQTFWPAPAEVHKALLPLVNALRWQQRGCEAVLAAARAAAAEKDDGGAYGPPSEEMLQAVRAHVAEIKSHASLPFADAKRHKQHQANVSDFRSQHIGIQSPPRASMPIGVERLPIPPIADMIVGLREKLASETDEDTRQEIENRIAALGRLRDADAAGAVP